MNSIESTVRGLHEAAHKTIAEGGECIPMLIVQTVDQGDMMILLDEFPPGIGPSAVKLLTERAMADGDVAAVFFMVEAWTVQRSQEEAERMEGPPSEQPDRQEAVMLTVTMRSGVTLYRWPICRPEGAPASVEWEPAQEYDHFEGRLIARRDGAALH